MHREKSGQYKICYQLFIQVCTGYLQFWMSVGKEHCECVNMKCWASTLVECQSLGRFYRHTHKHSFQVRHIAAFTWSCCRSVFAWQVPLTNAQNRTLYLGGEKTRKQEASFSYMSRSLSSSSMSSSSIAASLSNNSCKAWMLLFLALRSASALLISSCNFLALVICSWVAW